MQIGGETLKAADRVRIPIGTDRDVMDAVTDVDPCGVRMHDVESRVGGLQMAAYFGIKGMEMKKVKLMAAGAEETRSKASQTETDAPAIT